MLNSHLTCRTSWVGYWSSASKQLLTSLPDAKDDVSYTAIRLCACFPFSSPKIRLEKTCGKKSGDWTWNHWLNCINLHSYQIFKLFHIKIKFLGSVVSTEKIKRHLNLLKTVLANMILKHIAVPFFDSMSLYSPGFELSSAGITNHHSWPPSNIESQILGRLSRRLT